MVIIMMVRIIDIIIMTIIIIRPCRPGIESYVSSGRSLTLTQVFDS